MVQGWLNLKYLIMYFVCIVFHGPGLGDSWPQLPVLTGIPLHVVNLIIPVTGYCYPKCLEGQITRFKEYFWLHFLKRLHEVVNTDLPTHLSLTKKRFALLRMYIFTILKQLPSHLVSLMRHTFVYYYDTCPNTLSLC